MSFEPRTRLEKILCGVAGAAEAARTRIEKAVAIAIANASGGSSLPAVTSEDNGDLLGVTGGKWGIVDPPAGSLIVTLTDDGDTWTSDVEAADIVAAFEAGKSVYVKARGFNCPVLFASGEGDELAIMSGISMVANEDGGNYLVYLNAAYENQAWNVEFDDPISLWNMPFEVEGTLGEDAEQKATLTLNKTAAELFAAVEEGRLCKVMLDMPGEGDTTVTVTAILPCEVFKGEAGGNAHYTFKLRLDSETTDGFFYAADLAGSATVVLTEEATT